MTDVLGICTSWGDGRCVVAPEDGSAGRDRDRRHRVGQAGAAAARRPGTGCPPRDAEEHTLSLSPDLETEPLGDWVLRTVPVLEGRLVKRANSCLAIGDPGLDARARPRRGSGRSTRPATARCWPRSRPAPRSTARCSAAGWTAVPGGDADFLLASLVAGPPQL